MKGDSGGVLLRDKTHRVVYFHIAEPNIVVVVGEGMREGSLMCFESWCSRLLDSGVRGYGRHDERLMEFRGVTAVDGVGERARRLSFCSLSGIFYCKTAFDPVREADNGAR